MNSLPLISHHLFVAAIGNEGHAQERPTRQEKSFVELTPQPTAITMQELDEARLLTRGEIPPPRVPAAQVRA